MERGVHAKKEREAAAHLEAAVKRGETGETVWPCG